MYFATVSVASSAAGPDRYPLSSVRPGRLPQFEPRICFAPFTIVWRSLELGLAQVTVNLIAESNVASGQTAIRLRRQDLRYGVLPATRICKTESLERRANRDGVSLEPDVAHAGKRRAAFTWMRLVPLPLLS